MSIYDGPYAAAASGLCPCCLRQMLAGHPGRRPTRDHIRPRQWGVGPPEGRLRILCADCNGLRAIAGHCLATLACARDIAFSRRRGRGDWRGAGTLKVLRRWL